MSGPMPTDEQIEALARRYDLDAFRDEVWTEDEKHAQVEAKERALAWATWQIRHPGPLLAALAEAGVLHRLGRETEFMRHRDTYGYRTEWRPTDD